MPREWAEPQLRRMLESLCHQSSYVTFVLPPGHWGVAVDTAHPSPGDFSPAGEERSFESQTRYAVESRSAVVLVAR